MSGVKPWPSPAYVSAARHYDSFNEQIAALVCLDPIDAEYAGLVCVKTSLNVGLIYRLDWIGVNANSDDPRAYTSARTTEQTLVVNMGSFAPDPVLVASDVVDYHPGIAHLARYGDLADALKGMQILILEAGV